jgi:polyferredoxin
MTQVDPSLSLASPQAHFTLNTAQKITLALGTLGLFILLIAAGGYAFPAPEIWLTIALSALAFGVTGYAYATYQGLPEGVKNNGVWLKSISSKGAIAWVVGIALTGFYVLLYFFPATLGQGMNGAANTGLVALFDPLSFLLKKQAASQWFVYGALYSLAIAVLGIKFIFKYRHNRYQIIRTCSVIFFQMGFAFLLPEFMQRLNEPYYDFKNMWPLDYDFFQKDQLNYVLNTGTLGGYMILFGVLMVFVISPVLTYFYGKRWYCSWVCGCGGLAETVGDPFRQLSNKSLGAWKFERYMVHSVLLFATIMTIATLYSLFHDDPRGYFVTREFFLAIVIVVMTGILGVLWLRPKYLQDLSKQVKLAATIALSSIVLLLAIAYLIGLKDVFFIPSDWLKGWYGFFIGSIFSGVIGVGFYPIFGSRVWCRFGCPMAAILGLQQKFFSRFRITTNGGQCISCGNCSTYCEMGIDVRAYAQRGQSIVRASCVGCGVCAAVCPRGVLKLENSAVDLTSRTTHLRTIKISKEGIKLDM